MRLKENFFDSDEMKILESMQDGYMYSNILLKLYLKSLRNDGKLMFNDRIPYNSQMLATITGHQVGTIEKAMKIFKEMGLIEILETGEIYMLDIQNFIGKTSTEADRRRDYYNRIEAKKNQCEISHENSHEISTPKIEKDIDIEIDKKKDKKEKKKTDAEIIDSILESIVDDDLKNALLKFVDARKKMKKPLTGYAFELAYKKLQDLSPNISEQIEIVDQAIMSGWQSFYPLKKNNNQKNGYYVKPLPDYMKKVSNNPFLDMLEEEKQQ